MKFKNQYNLSEKKIFRRLNTPSKIQDFLNTLEFNFEKKQETCYSPRVVLEKKTAYCLEGAMLAAAILEFHGYKPLLLDLRAAKHDLDHVVALFRFQNFWGAISKTNHSVLRFREPVYSSVRELAMSYFHEYFDKKGKKTLREFSEPFDLTYFDLDLPNNFLKNNKQIENWRTTKQDLFEVAEKLDEVKHFNILNKKQLQNLRLADKIEIQAGEIVEWKK